MFGKVKQFAMKKVLQSQMKNVPEDQQQMMGPRLAIVNPLRWEIGHTAYFYEYWVLRQHLG